MVELKEITFENVNQIISLKCKFSQRKFVLTPSETLAWAYAGINENAPGFANAIYYEEKPVGLLLVGQAPVMEHEPNIVQKYEYVYRIMGLFIDKHYQNIGIGRKALLLALERVKQTSSEEEIPVTLECFETNRNAMKLYESLGFTNIGKTKDKNNILFKII